MRTTLMSRVPTALFALALSATSTVPVHAQYPKNVTVSGRVTDSTGKAIVRAQVYINDMGAVDSTDSDGRFTLQLKVDSARVGAMTNLRVRAIGFSPGVRIIRLGPENQTAGFQLRTDRAVFDSRVAMMTKVAKATEPPASTERPVSVPGMRVAQAQGGPAIPIQQADPFGRFMFTPEQVMQYQDAITLTQAQRLELQKAVEAAQSRTVGLQWNLAADTEKLTVMLAESVLDEAAVLQQTDRIMAMEREIKRAQMTLLIKIKNTLTAEQQARLRQLSRF